MFITDILLVVYKCFVSNNLCDYLYSGVTLRGDVYICVP